MRLILLGTGNAGGIPTYGCDCELCNKARKNPELRRGPACALIELGEQRYLLDAGLMDIAERFPAGLLDGILLTHFHPDHVQGLFHLRWGKAKSLPVYCPPDSEGCADLFKHPGMLTFLPQKKFQPLQLATTQVTPLPLIHSKPTFGYLFRDANHSIAYLTDTKGLPEKTLQLLKTSKLDLLVIDTSFPPGSEKSGHNNLDETLMIHRQLQPRRTLLTHISHELEEWLHQPGNHLPESVIPAHDGMLAFPL